MKSAFVLGLALLNGSVPSMGSEVHGYGESHLTVVGKPQGGCY